MGLALKCCRRGQLSPVSLRPLEERAQFRDAEIRGAHSPRLREHIGVYYLHHYFLKWVPWAGGFAAFFQILEWAILTDVVLPR